MYLNTKVKKLH